MKCSRCGAQYKEDPSCGKSIHDLLPSRKETTFENAVASTQTNTNLYCNKCGKTTKHSANGNIMTCSICGVKKYPQIWKKEKTFEHRIMVALGIICEEDDASSEYEPDGDKKETADGAHRFDKPVKYTQIKPDLKFSFKADQNSLH